jgi:methylenetetrahydrofolate reductase (NADPH)
LLAGWGRPGGYIYQKAYVEFFTSPNRLQALISKMAAFPSLTYIAVNVKGETYSNIGELRVSDCRLRSMFEKQSL